jgi:predicted transglutaminase-like cysteine proteinase
LGLRQTTVQATRGEGHTILYCKSSSLVDILVNGPDRRNG